MFKTESFYRARLVDTIGSAEAVPFIKNISKMPELDEGYITFSPDTINEEIMYYTSTTGSAGEVGTITITVRGYDKSTDVQSVDNQNEHSLNATIKGATNHIILNEKVNKTDLASTVGAKTIGIEDVDGLFVATTVEGALNELISGAPGVASATTTIAGKVELATEDELDTSTEIGDTGSSLGIVVANTTKTQVAKRVPVTNSEGRLYSFINSNADGYASTTENGLVMLSEATDLLSSTTVVSPIQMGYIGIVASDVLKSIANTTRDTNSTTPTLIKEIKIGNYRKGGSVRAKFDLRRSAIGSTSSIYARAVIYINGVEVGTTRSTDSVFFTTYTEDFNVEEGDLIQLYFYSQATEITTEIENFVLSYSEVLYNKTPSIILN